MSARVHLVFFRLALATGRADADSVVMNDESWFRRDESRTFEGVMAKRFTALKTVWLKTPRRSAMSMIETRLAVELLV